MSKDPPYSKGIETYHTPTLANPPSVERPRPVRKGLRLITALPAIKHLQSKDPALFQRD